VKFLIVADVLSSELLGGGEINNKILCDELNSRGYISQEVKSTSVTPQFIQNNIDNYFIVSNFVLLSKESREELRKAKYVIYEHDHKYLPNRNPRSYRNYRAPSSAIINKDFYKNAIAILCQSKAHSMILKNNLFLDNVKNLGGNLWTDYHFDLLEKKINIEKVDRFSIMDSKIGHKNTKGSVKYCEQRNADYQLISSDTYEEFLNMLGSNSKFCFFPKVPETFSRVVLEARMMGVEVHTNNRVGAASEDWFYLKKGELITKMKEIRDKTINTLVELFTDEKTIKLYDYEYNSTPKVSLVTSLYKGDQYIERFLENMTEQSIFEHAELIIINANSPGNEDEIINEYCERYNNIKYKKLDYDPGIYGCWNIGIEMAKGEYISNANLDDVRSLQQLEILVKELDLNNDIDLVYSECFLTKNPNETYENNSSNGQVYPITDFSAENMIKCLPGCMPVWRKSMHDNIGLFDNQYASAGDWEMWLRAVKNGSSFKKIEGIYGLYYMNPEGLSTDPKKQKEKFKEEKLVFNKYKKLFGVENIKKYKVYFEQK